MTGTQVISTHLMRNKRGIDTIVASLLMVIIVVVASFMVFAYATGLLGALLVAPTNTGREFVNLEFTTFAPDNKTVNLILRNTGPTSVTLVSYYVKDISGNQYAKSTWAGLTMSPTVPGNATIAISTDCIGCATTGTPFTFHAGNAYTITLVTSRNGAFPFTVIR